MRSRTEAFTAQDLMCQIGKHNLNADTQKSLFGPDFKIEKILGTQQENKNLLGMNGTGITENVTK